MIINKPKARRVALYVWLGVGIILVMPLLQAYTNKGWETLSPLIFVGLTLATITITGILVGNGFLGVVSGGWAILTFASAFVLLLAFALQKTQIISIFSAFSVLSYYTWRYCK